MRDGPNLARIMAIKKQYDPTSLFHLNHSIAVGR